LFLSLFFNQGYGVYLMMFLIHLIQIIDQGVRMQENAISFPFDEFYLWKGERGSFSQFMKIIATIASQMDTKK
jgi:hypothetical protein